MSKTSDVQELVFVRYIDHVLYHRTSALAMRPHVREAVGWLLYECRDYLTLSWDRDAEPPSLRGGDPKASGLVLLKTDILDLQRLKICPQPLQTNCDWNLNRNHPIIKDEFAFRPSERKTPGAKDSTRKETP